MQNHTARRALKKLNSLKKQAGASLIEFMIYVGLAALVIAGAVNWAISASTQQSVNGLLSDLTGLNSTIKALFRGQSTYGTVSLNTVLIANKRLPNSMTVSGSTVKHSLGGDLTVTGADTIYTMTLTEIPTEVCTEVAAKSNGFKSIKIGSAAAITDFPISVATASTQCSASEKVTLIFTGA